MATKNLNDYYGGGLTTLGGSVGTGSLNDLTDVAITAPSTGEALKFDGIGWTNDQISWLELTDKPVVPASIDDLNDVDTSSTPPSITGQTLVWNQTNSEWETGGIFVSTIGDLSDVGITTPANGEYLTYSGGTWVNTLIDYSEIQNTPTIPVNSDFALTGLSDTTGTAVADGFLRWNAAGTIVVYQTTIDATTDVSNLAAVATAGTIASLNDVDTTGATEGQILFYNSTASEWQAADHTQSRIQDGDNDTYVDVSSTDDTVIIQAGPTSGDILLLPDTSVVSTAAVIIGAAGGGAINSETLEIETTVGGITLTPADEGITLTGAPDNTITATGGLDISTASYLNLQGLTYPSTDGTNDQVLTTNGLGVLSWTSKTTSTVTSVFTRTGAVVALAGDYSAFYATTAQGTLADSAIQPVDSIDALADVDTTTSAPSIGEGLQWDGSDWVPGTVSSVVSLNDLSDVSITATALNQVLQWTGANFVNTALSYTTLSNLPVAGVDFAAVVHTHTIAQVTGLQGALDDKANRATINNMLDVNTSGVADGEVMQWSAGGGTWVTVDPSTFTSSSSRIENTATDTFVDTDAATDTVNITAPDGGGGIVLDPGDQVITLNGSASELSSTTALEISTVAGDLTLSPFTNTVNIPSQLTATAGTTITSGGNLTIDGQDFPAADGTIGQVLQTDGTGTLSWETPAAGVTTFIALTDTPVNYTGAADQYVKVNGAGDALEFATFPTDLVTSVFTRTGDVVAAASDYDASQVDNDSGVTGAFVSDALDTLDTDKADTVSGTANNLASLDGSGQLQDSGFAATDFATSAQGTTADSATQPADNISTLTNDSGFISDITGESIDDLSDVDTTTSAPSSGEALVWDGSDWVPGSVLTSPLTTKGDVLTYDTDDQRLAVGTNGQVLTANSVEATGLEWTTPTVAPVTSVFTRTGVVAAAASDYDASQVDNDSTVTGAFVDDALDNLDTDKADKVVPATTGDFAALDAGGNLIDGGAQAADFATAAQGTTADSALQDITAEDLGDLSDVNATVATNGQVLTWNTSNTEWEPATSPAGVTVFTGLTDTPANYTAAANKIVKVNSTPDALEYGADLADLEDVSTTAATDGQVLAWNNTGSEWEPVTPAASATRTEYFRIDYNLAGDVTDVATNVSEQTSNINTISFSSTANSNMVVDVTFDTYTTPPTSIFFYGYAYDTVVYNVKEPANTSNGNSIAVTGTSASPGALFGSFDTVGTVSSRVDRTPTGASNGAGFPGFATHAYIVYKF